MKESQSNEVNIGNFSVLKPGIIFSAGISRYASLIDGFQTGNILDDRLFHDFPNNNIVKNVKLK